MDIRCESLQPPVVDFLQLSRSRDFESAQRMVHKLDTRDPIAAFEIMRMHELRGSILDALCIAKPFTEGKVYPEIGISILFNIATAYLNCFHRGRWSDALMAATNLCTGGLVCAPLESAPKMKVGNSIPSILISVKLIPHSLSSKCIVTRSFWQRVMISAKIWSRGLSAGFPPVYGVCARSFNRWRKMT